MHVYRLPTAIFIILLSLCSTASAQFKVLVFSGMNGGFLHDVIPVTEKAIQDIGVRRGWTVDISETSRDFTDKNLARYDVVVWNNNCANKGGSILNDAQKQAFEKFIQSGKGYVGIHCASQAGIKGGWDWYGSMIGAINVGHPGKEDQFQTATIKVEDHTHPATRFLSDTWELKDEWFFYDKSPRATVNVLLSLDESTYNPGNAMGDHPIAWYKEYDGGRMFYTGIGHMKELFIDANFIQHLEFGIQWAGAGQRIETSTSNVLLNTRHQGAGGILMQDLLLDLNADSGLTLEDGDKVIAWKNQKAGPTAQVFEKRDEGRKVAGSGRPTLKKSVSEINGHNTLVFTHDELINMEADAFDHLLTGSGYTWYAVISVYEQTNGVKRDVNVFFGNLRNSRPYEGFWGGLKNDNTIWAGSRNGKNLIMWGVDNPRVLGPILKTGRYYIIAGRMGAGIDTVNIELFVDETTPVGSVPFPVLTNGNSEQMAVGTERDATNHPGGESYNGEMTRLLIYETALSDSDFARVMKALKHYYF
jgi:type 1 glutamine amidotransferase